MATGNATQHQQETLYAEALVLGAPGSQVTLTGAELGFTDGVTAGTAAVSKALVLGASGEIATITSATITTLTAPTIAGATTLSGALTMSSTIAAGSNATDRVTVKGIYMNPAVIAVAVPSIANDAAENVDRVDVDVSAAFSIQPAVGDAVIPIPMAALPTDCVLLGAYVSATDHIIVTFGSIEGGGGVTGANVNFNFLVFDLT